MTLFRTVAPAVEPVTLSEARAHMRLDHDSEGDLIAGLIRAAREEVERSTGLALIEQSWRLVLDAWPQDEPVLLKKGPVRAIHGVTVYGREGEAQAMAVEKLVADTNSTPARLFLTKRPKPDVMINGIEIDFSAGFGESGADVPDLLKRAILLLVAHWYEFRGAVRADQQPVSLPDSYRQLIASFREVRL
ncbi:head-tail connector protein [Nitratireductor basaltis]|uniref:Uncharacterized protein n=1 Tax=Nitratireductor basaltis TaxID=472175 RepID=A0A084UCG7_9HYPH|nr:head-tail connector protein [Nitratireductor basaltis]KFB10653.1 hypothetical protein EL18_01691 [Nitratireductor basaltis]